MPRSTVERVLRRRGLSRLDVIDRPTKRIVRRYERAAPGELIHVDVKKLGRIPDGGGWRAKGRSPGMTRGRGLGYGSFHYNWHRVHTAVGAAPATRLPINNVCVKDS